MPLTAAEAEGIARAGAAALQQGDPGRARAQFERLVAQGAVNSQILLLLAHCCRRLEDREAEEDALDRLLASEPRSIRALIMKGDCRADASDRRLAVDFYKSAIAAAADLNLPADLATELQRAEAAVEAADRDYNAHIETMLDTSGLPKEARSERFQQSLEILAGEKQIFLQQPTAYYLPGLPQIQFFDRSLFPWLAEVEAAFDDIRTEMRDVMGSSGALKPFIRSSSNRPSENSHGLMDNLDWSAFHLWDQGQPLADNIARCPRTAAALQGLPVPHLANVAPSIFFSVLRAGARIPPHHGMMNTRLVCHLPVTVPPECRLRVGNEVREWEEGRALIFDDSIEHEAWNHSDRDRVVLIFEIWRPELSEAERRAVTALFDARDSYGASITAKS